MRPFLVAIFTQPHTHSRLQAVRSDAVAVLEGPDAVPAAARQPLHQRRDGAAPPLGEGRSFLWIKYQLGAINKGCLH